MTEVLGHADRRPGDLAAVDPIRQLSYGDLDAQSRLCAAGLEVCGVGPGERVGIHLPNSVDFVVVALACLRLGAIFVPLAVSDPDARIAAIVSNAAPIVIVTSDATTASLPAAQPRQTVATLLARGADSTTHQSVAATAPSDGAYAIYTSGTTGTAKGVLIGRGAFSLAVSTTRTILGMDHSTRALCVSPFHFDGSFGTLFPTLAAGGCLVIPPRESLLFPQRFVKAVSTGAITHTGFSPSYLRLLLASPRIAELAKTELGTVALGGEASNAGDILALWAVAPALRIFNRYGPTETTIAVTHRELDRNEVTAGSPVPIGKPHPGVSFHVLDESGSPVADGEPGELFIGGGQTMIGYWRDPELTAEVLRSDVVADETVYRSGDVVRRTTSGDYFYLDRTNRVIKRNGVRVSLLEIADAFSDLEGVTAAVCVAFDNDGQPGIAAFVVPAGDLPVLQMRRFAGEQVPTTMMPDVITTVEELPLTSSGKVDERRLLAGAGLSSPR